MSPTPDPAYQLNALQVRNFKKFEDREFRFAPDFTVVIGDNASGKTALLEAAAIALSAYTIELPAGNRSIANGDVRRELHCFERAHEVFIEKQFPCRLEATATVDGVQVRWSRSKETEAGNTRNGRANSFAAIGANHRKQVQDGREIVLPLLCFYGTGRLWDEHRDVEPRAPESRLTGYRQALTGKSSLRHLVRTMKRLTLSSLQRQNKVDSPLLASIASAAELAIPGCEGLTFDVQLDELRATIEGHRQDFGMLSHGYRGMLGLVADLAHRCGLLNPQFGAEAHLRTSGIVLIDELDLHLHPKWQRLVVEHLQNAFPLVQFIATTHSPFIVQALKPGQVLDLNSSEISADNLGDTEFVAHPAPDSSFADRGVEEIAENVMGVESARHSARFLETQEASLAYLKRLEHLAQEPAQAYGRGKKELGALLAGVEEISDNPAVVAFLELQRAVKLKE